MKHIIIALAVSLLAGAVFAAIGTARADTPFSPHSLAGESPSAVGQYAIDYTRASYRVVSGVPTVLLVRPVTQADRAAFGLPANFPADEQHVLVILRGDFDLDGNVHAPPATRASQSWRFDYLGYIFDVPTGYRHAFAASPHGGAFSKILGDASLYDPPVVTPDPHESPASPMPPAPTPSNYWPATSPAPTVLPPKR